MKTSIRTTLFGALTLSGLLAAGTAQADRVSIGLGISNGYGNFLTLGVSNGDRRACGPSHDGRREPHGRAFFGTERGYCRPSPMIYAPRRVVCQPPPIHVVYAPAPVVVSSGYWVEREDRVWVEGGWTEMTDAWGRRVRTQQPGHWEIRRTREWVQQ